MIIAIKHSLCAESGTCGLVRGALNERSSEIVRDNALGSLDDSKYIKTNLYEIVEFWNENTGVLNNVRKALKQFAHPARSEGRL